MPSIRSFLVPPIIIGRGAAVQVGEEAGKLEVRKALVVTDTVMANLPVMGDIR
ncbi:hypothetical protein ACFLUJ_07175 [Chloroflexota bacterium]